MLGGVALVDGVLEVIARSRCAQLDVGDVLLLLGLQVVDHLGGLTYADNQHARSQRVECAGVANLYLLVAQTMLQGVLYLAYHIGRGPLQGFVDDGDVALLEVHIAK